MSNKLAHKPNYSFPCSHCTGTEGCFHDPKSEKCEYELCSLEELKKRIFIAREFTENNDDKAELDEMWGVFRRKYFGYDYDIYEYGLHHRVCRKCDGSGSIVDADGISTCDKCGGTGVIEHTTCSSHYTPLWFVFKLDPHRTDVSDKDLEYLYTTKEKAEEVVSSYEKHGGHYFAGEIIVSKNLVDLEDGTIISNVAIKTQTIYTPNVLGKIVCLKYTDTDEHQIVDIGNWVELHSSKNGKIPLYQDVEKIMSGAVIYVRMDKLNQSMSIRTKESTQALYWNLLMNTIMVYCNTYVTYSGADELITKYCGTKGICKNWSELRANVIKHVTTNNEGKLTDTTGKQLAEAVQEDFRQYGILIPLIDAFGVIEKLASIMGEDNVRLNIGTRKCDALVVFIIEYICLSPDAEFGNITGRED